MATSLKSVIPSDVMSAMLEETLRKSLVFGNCVNTNYQGVISGAGDSVLIPVIGDVTISDHTVNDSLTYEALDAANAKLEINQQKRFSFAVDDVDSRQAIIDVAAAYADRAAYQLKDVSDQYIASLWASAGATSTNLGTTGTPLTVTAANTTGGNVGVIDVLARIHKNLDEKNVPQEGRWIVIPPWFHSKLVLAGIVTVTGTTDQEAAVNGKVGYRMGFDIRMSNNCVNATTSGSKIYAGSNMAITFASQILNVETLRLETKFGTGVRGLYVYGAKVIQPDAFAVCTATETAG
jgi:hypothetical protein